MNNRVKITKKENLMKLVKRITICLFILLGLYACNQKITEKYSTVSINWASDRGFQTDVNVTSVVVEVLSSENSVLGQVELINSEGTWTGDIDITASNYGLITFSAVAYDVNGLMLYTGSTSENVPETSTVSIPMVEYIVLESGFVNGSIRDAVSFEGVTDVDITVYQDNTVVATGVSSLTGDYSIETPVGASYTVIFSHADYIDVEYTGVNVVLDTTTYLETIMQIDVNATGVGTASGTLTNAFDGTVLDSVTINIREGINNIDGVILDTITTDNYGDFSIDTLEAGHYTAECIKEGYVTIFVNFYILGGEVLIEQNASLTPIVGAGQFRFVLTWGESPSDLDSHIKIPGDTYNHVYFSSTGYDTSEPFVELDVDDTSSYGPETITIYDQKVGEYIYYVLNYSYRSATSGSDGSMSLAGSGAQVNVYYEDSLFATYNVPNQEGTLWKVCSLNGSTLTSINEMLFHSDSSSVTTRSIEKTVEFDMFSNLPTK